MSFGPSCASTHFSKSSTEYVARPFQTLYGGPEPWTAFFAKVVTAIGSPKGLGPLTINMLARDMVMDRTTLGRNILPLERDGLIRIEATKSDRRAKELHLTKAGEKRLQVAHERWSEAQSRFETTFGPRRAAELRTMLRAAVASEFGPADGGSAEFADR
ncbi:MAG: MarR family winged helix-turn-helix transcriptional regulator [Methylocella sp.]